METMKNKTEREFDSIARQIKIAIPINQPIKRTIDKIKKLFKK